MDDNVYLRHDVHLSTATGSENILCCRHRRPRRRGRGPAAVLVEAKTASVPAQLGPVMLNHTQATELLPEMWHSAPVFGMLPRV